LRDVRVMAAPVGDLPAGIVQHPSPVHMAAGRAVLRLRAGPPELKLNHQRASVFCSDCADMTRQVAKRRSLAYRSAGRARGHGAREVRPRDHGRFGRSV
jgi:hypothetical protein